MEGSARGREGWGFGGIHMGVVRPVGLWRAAVEGSIGPKLVPGGRLKTILSFERTMQVKGAVRWSTVGNAGK